MVESSSSITERRKEKKNQHLHEIKKCAQKSGEISHSRMFFFLLSTQKVF